MSFNLLKSLLPAALTLTCIGLFAQKPMPSSLLEIKLAPENENWHVDGNMRISEKTGFPAAIYAPGSTVTPATPEVMAREYLMANRALLGLSAENIQNLKLHAVRNSQTGVTVRLRQTWKGLPVNKNAEMTIHITPANVVTFVMNGLQYGITLDNVTPAIAATTARQLAVNHLNITGNISFESNTLMVLHHLNKDFLVYRVNIVTDSPVGEWETYVDAQNGTLLKCEDVAAYHHRDPVQQPALPYLFGPLTVVNGTGNTFDPDPLSTANAVYGSGGFTDASDADSPQLTGQVQSRTLLEITQTGTTYSLVGPYAEIRDFEAPSKGLFSQSSSSFAFSRNADAFEAVNCYFHIDNMMRYLNTTLGISVLPYQYAGGVRYDPSGLSGADNSHYVSGSGQLAFGEGGVDDAEDSDVVIHELGHGIHDWITSGGLSQVNGLSEGSGDYWASSYSRFTGTWPSSNAAYNWVFNWDGHNTFWTGRINNYTAIYPTGLVGQIHTDGQIWATAMMHIWDDIGRQKSDKIFWLGLDATNSSSSQNDAANAVYQAAISLGCTTAERLAIHTRFTAAGYTLPAFPLPIELVRFDGQKSGEEALLTWATASERDNDFFTIERSADGEHFKSIGQVKSVGNSSKNQSYALPDHQPFAGVNYYRLKQTDLSGATTLSAIVSVDMGDAQKLDIYPNPTGDLLHIRNAFSDGNISLYDATGKLVFSQTFTNSSKTTATTISLSTLPEGMYWVKLIADNQVMEGKVYKQ